MRRKLAYLLLLPLAAALAALLLRSAWLEWERQRWEDYAQAPLALEQPVIAEVRPGAAMQAVAADLASAGVIAEAARFSRLAARREQDRAIKAGQYRFVPGMSHAEALARMVAGEVEQARFAIIEGLRFEEILAQLRDDPSFERTLGALSPDEVWAQLAPEAERSYEGMLYPDTYLLNYGVSDLAVLQQAYERMQELLERQWARRMDGLPLASPYEALVLASIIEKETGIAGERARIASVFHNRLRLGMRLQSDPTVIYGLGDAFDGNLTRAHLEQDTPYNTYTRRGLPPTPIAIPSVAALEAALHPESSDYLYFVADNTGGHYFSKSLREHNNAVNCYQRRRGCPQ